MFVLFICQTVGHKSSCSRLQLYFIQYKCDCSHGRSVYAYVTVMIICAINGDVLIGQGSCH